MPEEFWNRGRAGSGLRWRPLPEVSLRPPQAGEEASTRTKAWGAQKTVSSPWDTMNTHDFWT